MFGIPPEILMSLITGVLSYIGKASAYKRQDQRELMEIALKQNAQHNQNQNDASQRSSPVLRKIVAIIVILVCFGGILAVSFFPEIDVSMLIPGKERSFLFGLFSWTGKSEIITATGLFLPEYWRYAVFQIISFLFGSGLAKATR